MTDWAEGKEVFNRGIMRKTDSSTLQELLKITLCPIILAAVIFTLMWERSRLVNIGYESQQLRTRETALLRAQDALKLEEETLKDPHRIDAVARNALGMAPLRPHQLLYSTDGVTDQNAPTRLAMSRTVSVGPEPRRPGLAY